jgi:hypothetical protein
MYGTHNKQSKNGRKRIGEATRRRIAESHWMTREGLNTLAHESKQKKLLRNGWSFGRAGQKSTTLDVRWMYRGKTCKMVTKNEINIFLKKGWRFGNIKQRGKYIRHMYKGKTSIQVYSEKEYKLKLQEGFSHGRPSIAFVGRGNKGRNNKCLKEV